MRTAVAARYLVSAALAMTPIASVAAQQAHINLDWAPHRNTGSLVPFMANVISPEVDDQRRVTFRVKAPRAQEVQLAAPTIAAGLGTTTATWPLVKGADGTWALTIGPVPQNIYVYKFLIDGVSVVDPNNTLGGFGNQPGYSTLVVHGAGPAYYDATPVPHGAITRHVYRSGVLQGEREMYVYTPPGYDRTKTYPVLYLLGGSGELASGWWLDGRAGFIADNLIADGRAVPMIIAMPNNQVVHRSDPKHAALTFGVFDQELRQEIMPLVEAQYRTSTDRHGRAIAGLSMGGRHTQLVGFKALDLFASFGVLSAGDPDSETSTPEFLNDPGHQHEGRLPARRARHAREPADQPQRRLPPDPGEAPHRARLRDRRQRRPRLGDVALAAARASASEVVPAQAVSLALASGEGVPQGARVRRNALVASQHGDRRRRGANRLECRQMDRVECAHRLHGEGPASAREDASRHRHHVHASRHGVERQPRGLEIDGHRQAARDSRTDQCP